MIFFSYRRNIFPVLLMAFFSAQPLLYSMQKEAPEQDKKEEILARISKIQPFSSKAITQVPQYVYENCNQVTKHNWSPEYFARLKKAVATITRDRLIEKNSKEGTFNTQSYTKEAEAYDWIHALNIIEQEFLSKPFTLTIENLQKINAYVTRLTTAHPGSLRRGNPHWNLKVLTLSEYIVKQHMDCIVIPQRLFNGEAHIICNIDNSEITVDSLKALLNHYKKKKGKINAIIEAAKDSMDSETAKLVLEGTIDTDCVDLWAEEQKGVASPGTIRFVDWLRKRIHFFPEPQLILPDLRSMIYGLASSPYPNHVKAALLWFDIVCIHPFDEANKRTGKLAAIILWLKSGYLPPIITKEDSQEFLNRLKFGFDNPVGNIEFAEFILGLVDRTQREQAALLIARKISR